MAPNYGRLRRSIQSSAFRVDWLIAANIENGSAELVYTVGKNQLGRQYDRCVRERLMELLSGKKIMRSLLHQMVIRRENADISEIGWRVADQIHPIVTPSVMENGRYGTAIGNDALGAAAARYSPKWGSGASGTGSRAPESRTKMDMGRRSQRG